MIIPSGRTSRPPEKFFALPEIKLILTATKIVSANEKTSALGKY
jgi:hypothetical protein